MGDILRGRKAFGNVLDLFTEHETKLYLVFKLVGFEKTLFLLSPRSSSF